MPLTQYKPDFPYKQNQIILSSDRIVLHSKKDSIFLFGQKAVAISTNGTLNVDAKIGMTVAAPVIELGADASIDGIGDPLIKAGDFMTQLSRILTQLELLAGALMILKSESTGFAASVPVITAQARLLKDVTADVKARFVTKGGGLNTEFGPYSKTTYTV